MKLRKSDTELAKKEEVLQLPAASACVGGNFDLKKKVIFRFSLQNLNITGTANEKWKLSPYLILPLLRVSSGASHPS